jgi:hypothetical protein
MTIGSSRADAIGELPHGGGDSTVILEVATLISMGGFEAGASGWASIERPAHADVPPAALRVPEAQQSSAEDGWRSVFGELWSGLALSMVGEPHAHPRRSALVAREGFEWVRRDLLVQWEQPSLNPRTLLRCAAIALECNVLVWKAFAGAAGPRHLHLLHRLEDELAVTERRVRAVERPRFVNRPAVAVKTRDACGAIDDLLRGEVDRADTLVALEDAAVELAALSVRIAVNLDRFGRDRRGHSARPVDLARQLSRIAKEVTVAAGVEHRALGVRGQESHLGAWLTAALELSPASETLELACAEAGDRSLRVDGLFSMRNSWLRVGVALSMVVVELDGLLAVATFRSVPHLERAVAARASHALSGAALCERPCDFDHAHAWVCHREALVGLVGDVCLALQTCDQELVVGTQQLAIRRLARALAAVWAIDERLRRGTQDPSHLPNC